MLEAWLSMAEQGMTALAGSSLWPVGGSFATWHKLEWRDVLKLRQSCGRIWENGLSWLSRLWRNASKQVETQLHWESRLFDRLQKCGQFLVSDLCGHAMDSAWFKPAKLQCCNFCQKEPSCSWSQHVTTNFFPSSLQWSDTEAQLSWPPMQEQDWASKWSTNAQ